MRTVYLAQRSGNAEVEVQRENVLVPVQLLRQGNYSGLEELVRCHVLNSSEILELVSLYDDYEWSRDAVGLMLEILSRSDLGQRESDIELIIERAIQKTRQLPQEALPLCRELSARGLLTEAMYQSAVKAADGNVCDNLQFYPFLIEENREFTDFAQSLPVVMRACVAGGMSRYAPSDLTNYLISILKTFDTEFPWLENELLSIGALNGLITQTYASMSADSIDLICRLLCVLLDRSTAHLGFARELYPELNVWAAEMGLPVTKLSALSGLAAFLSSPG